MGRSLRVGRPVFYSYVNNDASDQDNYRGITITSCLCKRFTVVIKRKA